MRRGREGGGEIWKKGREVWREGEKERVGGRVREGERGRDGTCSLTCSYTRTN